MPRSAAAAETGMSAVIGGDEASVLARLDELVHATEQFSGAEIEQVIVAALYTAFAEQKSLELDHIIRKDHR